MKFYVVHNALLVDRKRNLEEQFKKFNITNVEWVTSFGKDELVNIKLKTNCPLPLEYLSCSMKHYVIFNKIIENNDDEAIIFEDDVIISDYFNIDKIPKWSSFVKLGKSVPAYNIKVGNEPFIFENNAGSEAYYVKRMFVRDFMQNLTLGWNIDIEIHAYLYNNNIHLICLPMCYQEFNACFEIDKKEEATIFNGMDYEQYIYSYPKLKKYTFNQILSFL